MDKPNNSVPLNRRSFLALGMAGIAGLSVTGTSKRGHAAEKPSDRGEVFMMFSGNYTWSASVRSAIASCMYGGGDLGEIYKTCAVLQGKVSSNDAWFEAWNTMGERVALLGDQAGCEIG